MFLNKISSYLSVSFLILFAHSGLLKWVITFIDPTILFASLCSPAFFIWLNYKFYTSVNPLVKFIPLFLFFHLFLFLTLFYTISDEYYILKFTVIFSNLLAFFFPLIILNSKESLILFLKIMKYLFLICLFLILILLVKNQFLNFRMQLGPFENKIGFPDYLSLSYFLGSSIILFLDSKVLFMRLMLILAFVFMILLAGKGPLLFLILILLLKFRKKITIINFKFWLTSLLTITLMYTFFSYIDFPLFETLSGRLTFFSGGLDEDQSSLARVDLLNKAFDLILKNPFLGVGLGGFSKAIGQLDGRLSPHNLFFEIWVEGGFTSFVLFIFLIFIYIKGVTKINSRHNYNDAQNIVFVCMYLFFGNMVSAYLEDLRITYFWLGTSIAFYTVKIRAKNI